VPLRVYIVECERGTMQQLTLHVAPGADASLISDILIESFGAYSATVTDRNAGTPEEDPLFHQLDERVDGSWQNVVVDKALRRDVPLWSNAAITAYFPAAPECSLEDVIMSLFANFGVAKDAGFSVFDASSVPREVMAKNWVAHVQQSFAAVTIGRLRVRAPWHEGELDPGTVGMLLSPGQAFGTGEHPTTQLCIQWLQRYAETCPAPWDVLDYGCGSGILAIAAVLLGARSAVGCDLDEAAVETAVANAEANECSGRVRFGANGFEEDVWVKEQPKYGVVVANILASTLKVLAPLLVARVPGGGMLVLSGILAEQATDVAEVFSLHGMTMTAAAAQAGWVVLAGEKG
jgi:ribosomal protein L11 methyltransferase